MQRTPTTVPSDEELACRAQKGCARSFEQLMQRFQAPVRQFLRHRGNSSDAEDLLQETFIRVYANLHRYRQRWRFATWLFTIARRVSINHSRCVRPVADAEALRSAESGAPSPLGVIVAEEDRRCLWDMAAKVLCQEELTAVWLYYVEEMPTREIAAVLERSWVSVKTMMFRARRKLRTLLQDLEPDFAPQQSIVSPEQEEATRPAMEVSHV
jgi:RNA polymerase sigma-70 factor (ECF subfamily)